MANVSVQNIFLKETSLTSTKNKYVPETSEQSKGDVFSSEATANRFLNLSSEISIPRKRKFCFSNLGDGNALTSTENKFLPKSPLSSKKKKKKRRREHSPDRSPRFARIESESLSDDSENVLATPLSSKKKKKKRRQEHSPDRSRIESESLSDDSENVLTCDDQLDSIVLSAAPTAISAASAMFSAPRKKVLSCALRRSAPAAGPATVDSAYEIYRDMNYPASERNVPPKHRSSFRSPAANFEALRFGSAPPANFEELRFGSGPPMNTEELFGSPSIARLRKSFQQSGCFGSVVLPPISAVPIAEMPVYNFSSTEEYKIETHESFSFIDTQANLQHLERINKIRTKKMQFLNFASMALICSPKLKHADDAYRNLLKKYADDVKAFDPEFILKVALFSRQELNIRSATNFLLSYAAYYEETRPYLEKYFESCIRLPSDWIEVAELYQVFEDSRLKDRSLPSALKRVMVKSFSKFDEYQLAKYNRDKKKSGFTLKQLIRLLHLSSPANEIMCLLGKKYPESAEVFRKSKLPGVWDSCKAGKRMKLPTPETWETQISAYGNKPAIWEKLIDNLKLPYMAMLRNLKNLIISGISQKHHEKVLKQLQNKVAVRNSRQSPLQFYEAFKVLTDIEDAFHNNSDDDYAKTCLKQPLWKEARRDKIKEGMKNVSISLIESYKKAVSNALEISALHNLQPIPGKSLVICDIMVPKSLDEKRRKKIYQLCIMMGLMCLKACEDCKMNLICGNFSKTIQLKEDSPFLQSMMDTCSEHESFLQIQKDKGSVCALKKSLEFYLKQHIVLKEKLDHVVFLTASGPNGGEEIKSTTKSFLHKYRQVVNSELLYTDVDFLMNDASFTDSDSSDGKDVYLGGNPTQLIKFIAERSSGGQLAYVENIDTKYDLTSSTDSDRYKKLVALSESEKLPVLSKVPKWHTVRIFISSTFKDMHSERDLLIRYVMPELKKRAASVFVKINEVDLRWGITEADCASKRAAELCLLEAQRSDLFIGILGERYGFIYDFEPPDVPELQWVKEYPPGLSITELEMYAGALRENKLAEKRAYFYIRNNSFLSQVPEKYRRNFDSENPESKGKIQALKSKILSSGLKVYDGYPCNFAGLLEDEPVLTGLDIFGKTVLNDMWKAIKEMHEKDPYADDIVEEDICQQLLLESYDYFVETKNSPMEDLIKKIKKECGIFLITGAPGSGKTSFVGNMLQKLQNFSVIKFFIGLSPRSTELSYMLQYISNSIARLFPVSSVFPKLTSDVMNHFPDILQEAVHSSGNCNFILMLDGLDHLSEDDQILDWLPLTLPHGMRLICTASDSSYAFRVLSEREGFGVPVYIQDLAVIGHSDRESIVRHYLKLYGKSLDESSFNNQMLLLVTKKDSGIPLYLRLVCDFLRRYATFDTFMRMLQNLPSTMPLLLQEIMLQMENEYGSVLVQSILTLLCLTKEGLDDADLHILLSLIVLQKGKSTSLTFSDAVSKIAELGPDNMLSQVTFCSLVNTICTFVYGHCRYNKFTLIGSEFEKAVKKFYLNKNYSNFSKYVHCSIAAYYYTFCDLKKDGTWEGRSASAFRGLIFHLFYGQCYQELADYLCCLQFLEAIFCVGGTDYLLEYYSLLSEESRNSRNDILRKIDFSLLSSFNDFVSRNLHIFQLYPHLVMQQALNEPTESSVKCNLQLSNLYKSPVIECLSFNDHDLRTATLRGFFKNITAAACTKVRPHALLGSEDGYLKILDFASKKIIRSVKSHSSAITFICSAGKNRICTASTDTTLTLWSSVDYSRVSVLKGHKHIVSCCCADSSNTVLLSSGWDNSVRLWSLRDGSFISVIDFRCPVNHLDHHPVKQEVACGLWNGNIEIWHTVSLQKTLTLFSGYSSVKSLAYTSDGVNIIASYMNIDVIIWSEEGLKISSLKGHSLPVKSISYSPEENIIVSGSDDCTLKIWPTESGLSVQALHDCKFCPISLVEIISPNYLAVGYQNSEIWIMDITNGIVMSKMTLKADMASCFSKFDIATYASKNTGENWVEISLVLGTQSGKILVRNLLTSKTTTVGNIKTRVTAIIHNMSIIVCASSEGDIGLFSYPEITSKFVSGVHRGSVTALSLFVRNENVWIMSTGSDKTIKFWEIDYEELIMKQELYTKHNDYVTCCSWFPVTDQTVTSFLTGSHDNNIILQTGDSKTVFQGLRTSVINLAFTDNYIAGCGSDGSVALWSKDGKLLSYTSGVEQSSVVLSFRIDKDISGEFDITLAFVDKDGSVKIQKPNQRSFSYSLEGHSRGITSCCTSQTGDILSCSLDGTVNLWKIPVDIQETCLDHSAGVTGISISLSQNVIISSDAHGNIILWKTAISTTAVGPLVYGGRKMYVGGFVKALSLLKDKTFICAVTQMTDGEDKHFLDIISFECSSDDDISLYNMQVKCSHYLESEVLCLDSNSKTETIVAGLKSGNFIVITPNSKKKLDISEDWILGVKLFSHVGDAPENIFITLLNGSVKYIETSKILKYKDYSEVSFKEIQSPDFGGVSPYISTLCCESLDSVFCGDSQGWLRRYSNICPVSKKVHDDSITGISLVGSYVFTCSLDRTLKGWNSSLNQVCQFHSSVPITSFVACEITGNSPCPIFILVIGTSAGAVQLLKFEDKHLCSKFQ